MLRSALLSTKGPLGRFDVSFALRRALQSELLDLSSSVETKTACLVARRGPGRVFLFLFVCSVFGFNTCMFVEFELLHAFLLPFVLSRPVSCFIRLMFCYS